MPPMTPTQSRLAALAALIGAVALTLFVVAAPILWLHHRYDSALEDLKDRLSRYAGVTAQRPQIENRLTALQAKQAQRFYLKSSAPSLAATEIQETARMLIEQQGAKLTSLQILPHRDEEGLRTVTLNIQLTGKYQSVHGVLHALETAQPYLFLDNVSIRSPLGHASPNPSEAELYVQFDLRGYAVIKDES